MGTATAIREPVDRRVRSRIVTKTPTAELIRGVRGTPLGLPVVPDVSRTIRPGEATSGRRAPLSTATVDGSTTVTAALAASTRCPNSLSQTIVVMRCASSAAASASVRKSVLTSTTSAPTRAAAAELLGECFRPRLQLAIGDGAAVVDDGRPVGPPSRRHRQQGEGIRPAAPCLTEQPHQPSRAGRTQQPGTQQRASRGGNHSAVDHHCVGLLPPESMAYRDHSRAARSIGPASSTDASSAGHTQGGAMVRGRSMIALATTSAA
jgi:hypothetical protein